MSNLLVKPTEGGMRPYVLYSVVCTNEYSNLSYYIKTSLEDHVCTEHPSIIQPLNSIRTKLERVQVLSTKFTRNIMLDAVIES